MTAVTDRGKVIIIDERPKPTTRVVDIVTVGGLRSVAISSVSSSCDLTRTPKSPPTLGFLVTSPLDNACLLVRQFLSCYGEPIIHSYLPTSVIVRYLSVNSTSSVDVNPIFYTFCLISTTLYRYPIGTYCYYINCVSKLLYFSPFESHCLFPLISPDFSTFQIPMNVSTHLNIYLIV